MRRTVILPLLRLVLALAFVTSLCAQASASPENEAAARELFREGLALHEARDFAGAITKYEEAYDLWQNPKILTNIGTAAWELGRFAEAADAYDRYLLDAPAGDPSRPEVEKALAEVLPKVGTLKLEIMGTATRVIVDGELVDNRRLDRVRVMPGSHTVEATNEAGGAAKQTVEVAAGATVQVALTLAAAAAPAPPPNKPADAPADEMTARARPGRSALPWILVGGGAVALAASGVFFILRNGAVDDLDQSCIEGVCPGSSQDTIDRANQYGLFSVVAFGVGVVGVGAGVVLLLTDGETPSSAATLQVKVAGAPGSARAVAAIRF